MELKMNMARNMYGMHAPIKMAMERSLVIQARGPSMLPQRSNLGLDILAGKDESIDFEDFLNGMQGLLPLCVHFLWGPRARQQ